MSPEMIDLNSLKSPLFVGLSSDQQRALLQHFEIKTYEEGDVIIKEGEVTPVLGVILSGTARVTKDLLQQSRNLSALGPGAVFGEMSFFQGLPHSATVIAEEKFETLEITKAKFQSMSDSPCGVSCQLSINLLNIVSDRLRHMDQWVCELLSEFEANSKRHQEWIQFRNQLYTNWNFA